MYVRKTETLMSDIRSKIRRMERQALDAHPRTTSITSADTTLLSSMVEVLNNVVWSEAPELKGKIPKSWLQHHNDARLNFRNDEGVCFASLWLDPPRGDKFSFPLKYSGYNRPEVDIHPQHYNEVVKKWAATELASKAKRAEIEDQFGTVLDQVTAFMGQHASLNAAVKAMPEIELYVPDEYLSRMRAPTPPRAKKAAPEVVIEELNIDVNALASAAIAHRIASAGS